MAFTFVKVDLFGREGGLKRPETWSCWSVIYNEVPDFLETTNEIHVNQITASLNFMNGILKYKQSNQISDYNLLPELSRLYGFWNDSRREHMLNDFDKYKIDYEINNINIRFWLKKN